MTNPTTAPTRRSRGSKLGQCRIFHHRFPERNSVGGFIQSGMGETKSRSPSCQCRGSTDIALRTVWNSRMRLMSSSRKWPCSKWQRSSARGLNNWSFVSGGVGSVQPQSKNFLLDRGSTNPRSRDELTQLRTHTTHYSPGIRHRDSPVCLCVYLETMKDDFGEGLGDCINIEAERVDD